MPQAVNGRGIFVCGIGKDKEHVKDQNDKAGDGKSVCEPV